MKQVKILLLASMAILFTACGGGGGSSSDTATISVETPQITAIDKIKLYADDNTQPTPTIQDYVDAGVVGITAENINDVNSVVASLTANDVDTAEKIQKVVNDLGINILPTAYAGPDKVVEVNRPVSIIGNGTDIDGTIVSYEWKKGDVILATTASFNYTPQTVGIDTLTLTIIDDDGGTASDSTNITVSATPPPPDTTAPVITVNGSNPVTVNQNSSYIDAGATATDNVDGTVSVATTGTVNTSTIGVYTITYQAKDSAGNTATVTRTVNVVAVNTPDTIAPVITVLGSNPVTVNQNSSYNDAGATATDDRDGSITVIATGSVDTATVGIYTITYNAKDNAGNTAIATRTVNVNSVPVATFSSFSTNEDNEYLGKLTADDSVGESLTYIKVSEPANGNLVVNSNGDFSYIPSANYFGQDSFQYKVFDGVAYSNVKEVIITVNPINDAPIVTDINMMGHSRSILSQGIVAQDVEGEVLSYAVSTPPAFGEFNLDTLTGKFTFKPQSNIGYATAVIEVTDGKDIATLNINFDISEMQISSAIQMCDSYANGSNNFYVDNGLIKAYSKVTLNIANTLDGNISISSGKLYNGANTQIYAFTSEVQPSALVKATATYYKNATSLDNYWIIKFKDILTSTNYIARYTYDSLEGTSISSSMYISSTGTIGCYDTPYQGTYLIEEDLGFDIAPIDDMLVSEPTTVTLGLNDAIINNNADITVTLEPTTGMSAIYSNGTITIEPIDSETKANIYTVTVTASNGVNSDTEVFNVEYALHHDVTTTTEFRQALIDASQNGMNDVIVLADGIYLTTDDGLGEFSFTDNEFHKLMLKGSSPDNVILSGGNTDRVLNYFNSAGDKYDSNIKSLHLENITIENGYVDSYGAGVLSNGDVYAHSVIIKNNLVPSPYDGGGICTYYGISDYFANLYISNSIIENNSARFGGGFVSWNAEIKNSIIKDNIAQTGGGGFNAPYAQIYNSLITSNIVINTDANSFGGAFHVTFSLSLVNSLIKDNNKGITLTQDDSNFIANTVFVNNGVYDIKEYDSFLGPASVQIFNSYFNGVMDINYTGSNNLSSGNLSFVDEANEDYHLISGSALIDAGTDTATGVIVPTTDFDGNPRPVGISTDIGPYEYQQ